MDSVSSAIESGDLNPYSGLDNAEELLANNPVGSI
jgi:hypothetical protein